jgi:hypothetical protein
MSRIDIQRVFYRVLIGWPRAKRSKGSETDDGHALMRNEHRQSLSLFCFEPLLL